MAVSFQIFSFVFMLKFFHDGYDCDVQHLNAQSRSNENIFDFPADMAHEDGVAVDILLPILVESSSSSAAKPPPKPKPPPPPPPSGGPSDDPGDGPGVNDDGILPPLSLGFDVSRLGYCH
jgi:hypothetical protein